MTINIQGYLFEVDPGPIFNNKAGIYVLFTNRRWLDVGQTDNFINRITNHDRKDQWINNSEGLPIRLAVREENSITQRLALERLLRLTLRPYCGER